MPCLEKCHIFFIQMLKALLFNGVFEKSDRIHFIRPPQPETSEPIKFTSIRYIFF